MANNLFIGFANLRVSVRCVSADLKLEHIGCALDCAATVADLLAAVKQRVRKVPQEDLTDLFYLESGRLCPTDKIGEVCREGLVLVAAGSPNWYHTGVAEADQELKRLNNKLLQEIVALRQKVKHYEAARAVQVADAMTVLRSTTDSIETRLCAAESANALLLAEQGTWTSNKNNKSKQLPKSKRQSQSSMLRSDVQDAAVQTDQPQYRDSMVDDAAVQTDQPQYRDAMVDCGTTWWGQMSGWADVEVD